MLHIFYSDQIPRDDAAHGCGAHGADLLDGALEPGVGSHPFAHRVPSVVRGGEEVGV